MRDYMTTDRLFSIRPREHSSTVHLRYDLVRDHNRDPKLISHPLQHAQKFR
jgi:hypothetical protein